MLARDYPVIVACDILGMARSSYYYQAAESPDEPKLKEAIKETAADWPTYGYRRIAEQLKRNGWEVNHKRVRRLMRLMHIQAKKKQKKKWTTDSKHGFPRYPNLVLDMDIVRPDQVWVCDITYIRLHRGFVYLAVIMDVFARGVRGWHLGRGLDHSLTLTALRRALATHSAPEVHHSDQGIQYAATAYTQVLHDAEVQISMADKGAAWQNGYAERLIRTIKEEEVDLSEYLDYHDAYQQIGRFLDDVYVHKRIHSSLGYLTPAEYEAQWQGEHTLVLDLELTNA